MLPRFFNWLFLLTPKQVDIKTLFCRWKHRRLVLKIINHIKNVNYDLLICETLNLPLQGMKTSPGMVKLFTVYVDERNGGGKINHLPSKTMEHVCNKCPEILLLSNIFQLHLRRKWSFRYFSLCIDSQCHKIYCSSESFMSSEYF